MRNRILITTMLIMLIAGMLLSGCATPEGEYNKAKDYIQNVVREYMVSHSGEIPPCGDIINTSECTIQLQSAPQSSWIYSGYLLDFCYLLNYCIGLPLGESCDDYEYFPFELPICCYGQSGQEGTNFYTGNCTHPYKGHYIWLVDVFGNVCSVCIGDDCRANNESGYQGVWP